MRINYYDTIDVAALIALLALAVLSSLSYTRWHFWWRSAFGRAFMAILVAFACRTPRQIQSITDPRAPESLVDWLLAISLTGTVLAALALSYLVYATIRLNIHQTRTPRTELARDYLEQTPWATPEEIKELVACWDELRHSDASVQPAQDTP